MELSQAVIKQCFTSTIPFLTHYSYIVSDILCMWIHAHSAELKEVSEEVVHEELGGGKGVAELQLFPEGC